MLIELKCGAGGCTHFSPAAKLGNKAAKLGNKLYWISCFEVNTTRARKHIFLNALLPKYLSHASRGSFTAAIAGAAHGNGKNHVNV